MNLWNYMAVVSPALEMFKKHVGRNRYVVQDPLKQQDGLIARLEFNCPVIL